MTPSDAPDSDVSPDLLKSWQRHDPFVLAALALLPRCTAEWVNLSGQARKFYRLFDEAAFWGWCDITAAPEFVGGQLMLKPLEPSKWPPMETSIHPQVLADAIASGVLREPIGSPPYVQPSYFMEVALPVAGTTIRTTGIRFRAAEKWPVGMDLQINLASFAPTPTETTPPSETKELGGKIIECSGTDWSGYEIGCCFPTPAPSQSRLSPNQGQEVLSEPWALVGGLAYSAVCPRQHIRSSMAAFAIKNLKNSPQQFLGEICKLLDRLNILPADMACWRKLAGWLVDLGIEGGIRQFDAEVRRLIESQSTEEALNWMLVAEPLAEVFGTPLRIALELNERRLEVQYRRQVDARYLHSFFKRKEQVLAFTKLIEAETGTWALHYLGVGGVGKTMLMRHIIRQKLESVPFALVDFDFLKPEYPVQRPGQLILELADGLRIFAKGRTEDLFEKFRIETESFHLQLEQLPASGAPLAAVRDWRFDLMLNMFADFLRELVSQVPTRPRVVLILDTCEELARLRSRGEFLPAVEATFEILDKIHARCDFVRVVLAGRLPLGGSGAGWKIEHEGLPAKAGMDRKFMRLHVIRGFDEQEARTFLAERKAPPPESKRPPIVGDLATAILSVSPEEKPSAKIVWDAEAAPSEVPRYNPFELSLLADWYLEDESVSMEKIGKTEGDPYVEHRVLARLAKYPRLISLLPYLVLLPKCERGLIRTIFEDIDDTEFDLQFRELCQLQWLTYWTEDAGLRRYFRIQDGLRRRLRRCFRSEKWQPELRRARVVLQPLLIEALLAPVGLPNRAVHELAAPTLVPVLTKLDLDQLGATLQLLDPDEGTILWGLLETAWIADRQWTLAAQICEHLLKDRETLPPQVRASVLSSRLAAWLRTGPSRISPEAWAELAQETKNLSEGPWRFWFRERAELGEIAAMAKAGVSDGNGICARLRAVLRFDTDQLNGLSPAHVLQLFGSRLAAIEAVLEVAETSTVVALMLRSVPSTLDRLFISGLAFPDPLSKAFEVAALRWRMLESRARDGIADTQEPVIQVPEDLRPPEYLLDWVPAACLSARLRLEALRWQGDEERVRKQSVSVANQWFKDLVTERDGKGAGSSWLGEKELRTRFSETDYERLAARCLQLRLAERPIPAGELQKITYTVLQKVCPRPECAAHRATPPLFVILAEAWLAAGLPDDAVLLLSENERYTAQVKDAADWNQRTILKVERRMRWGHYSRDILRRLATSGIAEDEAAAWPLWALIPAEIPVTDAQALPPERLATWWKTRNLGAGNQIPGIFQRLVEAANTFKQSDPKRLDLLVCAVEALIESGAPDFELDNFVRENLSNSPRGDRLHWLRLLWQQVFSDYNDVLAEDAVRADPTATLDAESNEQLAEILKWVGAHEAAEYALSEGELRLQQGKLHGILLIDIAAKLFKHSGTKSGVFICAVLRAEGRRQVAPKAKSTGMAVEWAFQSCAELRTDLENTDTPELPPAWASWIKRLNALKRLPVESSPAVESPPAPALAPPQLVQTDRLTPPPQVATPKSSGGRLGFVLFIPLGIILLAIILTQTFRNPGAPQTNLTPTNAVPQTNLVITNGTIPRPLIVGFLGLLALLLLPIISGVAMIRSYRRLAEGCRLEIRADPPPDSSSSETNSRLQFKATLRRPVQICTWVDLMLAMFSNRLTTESVFSGTWERNSQSIQHDPEACAAATLFSEIISWSSWMKSLNQPISIEQNDLQFFSIPWERDLVRGYLAAASGQVDSNKSLWRRIPFRPYRCQPVRAQYSDRLGDAKHVLIVGSPRYESTLPQGWEKHGLTPLFVTGSWQTVEAEVHWPQNVRVLHLLGRPLATPSAGIVLKVESYSEFRTQSNARSDRPAEELLITPGKRGLDQIPLIIVQAAPAEVVELNSTDWLELARLRAFSARLFEDGNRAVLLIPMLPEALFESILPAMGLAVGGWSRFDLQRLLELTNLIRDHVETWNVSTTTQKGTASTPRETLVELSMAVTLFARHNFIYTKHTNERH